jgi:hypothetical protein
MTSKTSIHVFILTTIRMRTTNGVKVMYKPTKKGAVQMARHIAASKRFSIIEDGFNHWWKECIMFGRWLTFNKSCVAGWYHSPIMQGPDPTPICPGATIHLLAITHGNLALYKVHFCVFGRAMDGDLGKANENTVTT